MRMQIFATKESQIFVSLSCLLVPGYNRNTKMSDWLQGEGSKCFRSCQESKDGDISLNNVNNFFGRYDNQYDSVSLRLHAHEPLAKCLMHVAHFSGNTAARSKSNNTQPSN